MIKIGRPLFSMQDPLAAVRRIPLFRMLVCLAFVACVAMPAGASESFDPSGLSPDARERVLDAASNPALSLWQQQVMLEVVGAGTVETARPLSNPRVSAEHAAIAYGEWRPFAPEWRTTHTAIYDPLGRRMIVFGGFDTRTARNDTWELSLSGAPTWTELAPTAPRPPARYGHSAIYDASRNRMVIFGGYDGTNRMKDVWALSLSGSPAWTDITPPGGLLVGPTPRYYHTANYDPVRDRMLVLGGYDSFYLGDVWALSLGSSTWNLLAPSDIVAGSFVNHVTIYDPVRDRLVAFGGTNGVSRRDTTLAFALSGAPTWSQIVTAGTRPLANTGARGAYDAARDRLVLFGGYDGSYRNAVWALTFSGTPTWSELAAGGAPPSGRAEAATVYDPVSDRIIICNGVIQGSAFYALDDAWMLPLSGTPTWVPLQPAPPAGRVWPTATVDLAGSRLIIFGGHDGLDLQTGTYFNDVRALPLGGNPVWINLAPTGIPPAVRAGHTSVYDPLRQRLLVFGGQNSTDIFNDVWELSLTGTPRWTQLIPAGTPPSARSFHAAIYDSKRDRILVFGGHLGVSFPTDTWELTLSGALSWNELVPVGAPPPGRAYHVAIYDFVRDRVLVYGGSNFDTGALSDLWALNLSTGPAWVSLTQTGHPFPQGGYAGIHDSAHDRMLLFGGHYSSSLLNKVYALSLSGSPTWTYLPQAGQLPPAREHHAVAYDRRVDRMLVFGGVDGSMRADVWALYWGTPVAVDRGGPTLDHIALAPPRPNPFRSRVSFEFELPREAQVRAAVYDLAGRRVRRIESSRLTAGRHTRTWDGVDETGASVPSGIYLIGLSASGRELYRKVVLIH